MPTNPTTVTFTVENPDLTTDTYVFGVDVEVTNPSVGQFVLELPAQSIVGTYHYSVVGTGSVEATSQGDFTITPVTSEPGVPGFGPCTPWCDASDVAACAGVTLSADNNDLLAANAISASQMLFELEGRMHSGLCEKTVRPCNTVCGCNWQVLSRGFVVWTDAWLYGGGYWGGWNCGDDAPCGCWPLSRVKLSGYPVRSVTEVKIDGAVLAPDEYRLDESRYVTRLNDHWWPGCQDLSLADTESGTWSITYNYGAEPPLLGKQAAAQLGGELYSACTTGECALPKGTTRVTRQGVTIEKLAFTTWGFMPASRARGLARPGWNTGLPLVDAFLNTLNRNGIPRRPTFYAPSSTRRYARPVGP